MRFNQLMAPSEFPFYPQTRKADQVDDYHGVPVADPYRWLEDDRSAETAAWVEAENKVTFGYLDKHPLPAAAEGSTGAPL
jgi:prolyl oligopeptidase